MNCKLTYKEKRYNSLEELLKNLNINPLILKSEIEVWQERNNTDRFPTIEEYNKYKNNNINNDTEETYYDIEENISDEIIPQTKKILKLKQERLNNLYKRLNQIKIDKEIYKSNKTKYKNLLEEQTQIQHLIYGFNEEKGLAQEIRDLSNITTFDILLDFIDTDINRLETIIYSQNFDEKNEAYEIINFYEAVNPLSSLSKEYGNPLFSNKFIFDDDGNFTEKYKEVYSKLEPYMIRALAAKAKLEMRDKIDILNIVNEDERVERTLGKKLSKEELFEEKGLKDINYLTMFMQDPEFQFGITSKNTILVNMMKTIIGESVYRHRKYSSYLDNKLSEIEPDLLKQLKKGNFNQPDFNIFRLKDENGLYTDTIIQRFNPKLQEIEEEKQDFWEEELKDIYAKKISITERNNEIRKLKLKILNWNRENFNFLDIRKIPEIVNKFPELFGRDDIKTANNESYINSLKELLGEYGYNEEVQKQIKLIEEYIVSEQLFNEENIEKENYEELKYKFLNTHNPIYFLNSLDKFEQDNDTKIFYTDLNKNFFVHKIPRQFKAKVLNNRYIQNTKENTGYYVEEFKEIEKNRTFKEFHNILTEFYNDIINNLSAEERKNINIFSIPTMEKSIIEILKDPNRSLLESISEAFKQIIQKLKELIRERVSSNLTFAHLDTITNQPKYQINTDFLNFNKLKIQKLTNQNIDYIKSILKIEDLTNFNMMSDNGTVLNFLTKNLNIEPHLYSLQEAFKTINFNENFNLEKVIEKVVTHSLIMNQTMDIPKVIRAISYQMAAYKGRKEALPLLAIMKKQYEDIKKPILNKQGVGLEDTDDNKLLSGYRENAIKQFDSWFNRVVLGNYVKKSSLASFIDTKMSRKLGIDVIDNKVEDIKNNIRSQKNNKEQTLDIKEQDNQNRLEGKEISFSAFMDNIVFSSVRFLGLGYNMSSAITNFFEGQFANLINANKYFPEEYLYEGLDIVKYSTLRTFSGDKLNGSSIKGLQKAELLRYLMDNYDVLQDVYNEMQRTSVKSRIDKLRRFQSKEVVSRVEYNNQAPILYAILRDTEIIGKDGNKTSLWEAFMSGIEEGKQVGKLSNNFSTEENINSFEINTSKTYKSTQFTNLKLRVVDTIKKIHGDYDELSGNLASESIEGNALFMFKRWLGSYLYNRFGTEQANIHSQRMEKGRYRSLTSTTAGMYGSVAGLLAFGPLGGIIGAGAAILPRTLSILGIRAMPINNNLSLVNEILDNTAELFKKFISIPGIVLTGKQMFKHNSKLNNRYSQTDLNNIKSNLTEIALLLWCTAFLLLVKSLAWDDDDDENSKKRMVHNFVVNKLMQLSDQTLSFLNPSETWNTFFGSDGIAVIRFINNAKETVNATIKYINGEDIIQTGVNAGDSRLWNNIQKTYLPAPLRGFGFSSSSGRQFQKSPFDKWFYSDEKTAQQEIRILKANEKSQLDYYDLSEEEKELLDIELNKKYSKKKNETYQERLEKITNGD